MQGELASTNAELARASDESEKLRAQLSTAIAESGKLRSDLAKLTEETAIVERKLAVEVLPLLYLTYPFSSRVYGLRFTVLGFKVPGTATLPQRLSTLWANGEGAQRQAQACC